MDVPEIPRFAELSTEADINYLCNIRDDKDYNIKYLPKEKVIVMRNCDTSGNLLDLKLSKSRFIIADPWAMLRIKTFRDCGQDIQVPICKTCNNHMDNLAADQSIENLKSMLCNHAKIASNIIRNFDNPVNLSDDDSNDLKVEIIHKKEDRSSKSQHLAVVFQKRKLRFSSPRENK